MGNQCLPCNGNAAELQPFVPFFGGDGVGVGEEVNGEEILLTQQASSQNANYFAFKAIDFHIH